MRVPFVDLKVQYEAIREELERELQKVFEKMAFIMGPALRELWKGFSTGRNSSRWGSLNELKAVS